MGIIGWAELAANAVLWAPGAGRAAANAKSWAQDLYTKYVGESLDRYNGVRPRKIEFARMPDPKKDEMKFEFQNVQIVDFEKREEDIKEAKDEEDRVKQEKEVLESALDALKDDVSFRELNSKEKKERINAVIKKNMAEVTKPKLLEAKPVSSVLYKVSLITPKDIFVGQIDFGDWEKLGCKVEITKADGTPITGTEEEIEKIKSDVLRTLKGDIQFSLKKGLLFSSNPGIGKTFIFEELLPSLAMEESRYKSVYRKMTGYDLADYYKDHSSFAFREFESKFTDVPYNERHEIHIYDLYVDDFFRASPDIKHYGNEMNFYDMFFEKRIRLQKKHGCKTHFTTNHDLKKIKEVCSPPTYSRLFQLFNIIFINTAKDFRINL